MSQQTLTYPSVSVGDKLPQIDIDVSTALVVGGALASRDFTPVHHDLAAAKATGMQDVFMNILTTNGLVARYATDWAGPEASIKKLDIKLGVPNFPGMVMKMTGSVTEKDDANGIVEIEIAGKNTWGAHVTGTVQLALPTEA
jgi:acyl dehydratase